MTHPRALAITPTPDSPHFDSHTRTPGALHVCRAGSGSQVTNVFSIRGKPVSPVLIAAAGLE